MTYILRLTQITHSQNQCQIEVSFEGDGLPRQTALSRFEFELTAQDQEDIRWYLEDFLQYPLDPAPKVAERIEKRMDEIGGQLFKAIFQSNDDARDLWATLRLHLSNTRVEIVAGVNEAASIPWELIRDPKTDTPLALRAHSFIRTHTQTAQRPMIPQATKGAIRLLLVISRPSGSDDVPFRSVASYLIKSVSDSARKVFQLDVLRPTTFHQLARVLREAKAAGQPYHIVHFDGHGVYTDVSQLTEPGSIRRRLNPLLLSGPRSGAHGYLLFENTSLEDNMQFVDGPTLGKLLVETAVPVLVLNACQSAYANPPQTPITINPENEDLHDKVRTFGSLAHEIVDAGVAGVVAMRYSVYVVTAAQFVADLYASLVQGNALGTAVTLGRKQLAVQPLRDIGYAPCALQDWVVPVVYEAAPIRLFPKAAKIKKLTIKISDAVSKSTRGIIDPELPPTPDTGFFGRDETLLALDRALDSHSIVLLQAYAGSGKTTTVAEFARWYALTGGIKEGQVLFTTFEQHKTLTQVLDQMEQIFGLMLEQNGVNWLALPDQQRRQVALQILRQVPVLWIWDNVETVTGFPAGATSSWSAVEQKELANFLRETRGSKAKFLLTSRRAEQEWLGNLPARVTLPPMPMQERVQLLRSLANKHGRRLTNAANWHSLLEFTQGNPLTLTVLSSQVLRDGLLSKEQIHTFVDQLRSGEAIFEDEESEGRSKSLAASLRYGFQHSFNEDERKQLALLYFFQGFVDVEALGTMGNPQNPACLPEARRLNRNVGIKLLDRAAEAGLLVPHGNGYYSIHPALPWFFKKLFDEYYSPDSSTDNNKSVRATRAFVEAMKGFGDNYHNLYADGKRDVIEVLKRGEATLIYAFQLARKHNWLDAITGILQGLAVIYEHTGRRVEWAQLLHAIVPECVDPKKNGPLSGREKEWVFVTQHLSILAQESLQWKEAEPLQEALLSWARRNATPFLSIPPKKLNIVQSNAVQNLSAILQQLGDIQRELQKPACIATYKESMDLAKQINHRTGAATCAFNIAKAYHYIVDIYNLDEAELWYRRSLDLRDVRDNLGRSKVMDQIGLVIHERFKKARDSGADDAQLQEYSKKAIQAYKQSLELSPKDALDKLALSHQHLGNIYAAAGQLNLSLKHSQEALRYFEATSHLYNAAETRFNIAITLNAMRRFKDAKEYAYTALSKYEIFGKRAAEKIQKIQTFIAMNEQELKDQ